MKILHTPARFFPYIGGVENYVYYLCRELVRYNHQVYVLCANEPFCVKRRENLDGIDVKRLNYIFKIANTNITPSLPFELIFRKYDIIHTHLPHPYTADFSNFISFIKRKPLVLTYHNDIYGSGIYKYFANSYNILVLPFLLKFSKKIIITHKNYYKYSNFLKDYIRKIEVVPPGVDTDIFKPIHKSQKNGMVILFLSLLDEFHRYKGLEYLLKAIKIIVNYIKDVKLLIGGDGSMRNYYVGLSNSLGIDRYVEFLGFIPKDKLLDFYNKGDIFVLPSLTFQEGFGIVALEAMASAKPVIVTNVVGSAESIKEANAGIVIEPYNEEAIAYALIEILRDNSLRDKMSKNALELIKKSYNWRNIASRILKIYREVQ